MFLQSLVLPYFGEQYRFFSRIFVGVSNFLVLAAIGLCALMANP
jgi:hypothetical protein